MHELSLALEMVEQIVSAATENNAIRVERVVVVIGAYSGVEREAFELAFPFAAENTMAEGADLQIEDVPAAAVCNHCHAEFTPTPAHLVCETCGSEKVVLRGGREFLIRSIDLEVP